MENDQMFYITYDPEDHYINGMVTASKYNNDLTPEQKKQYIQVFIDRDHIYGWGRYWKTCRYVNGVVSFPGNWPADQSVQIDDLAVELKEAQSKEAKFQKQVQEKVNDNNGLQRIVMNLQEQIASIQAKLAAAKKGDDK